MTRPPEPARSAVRRLAEQQAVVLDLAEEAIDCRVTAVGGDAATLEPVAAADAAYIPSLGRAAALVFESSGRRVRVRGAVTRGAGEGTLRFTAGDGSRLPRRRQVARVGAELHAVLTPLGDGEAPAGEPRRVLTTDVSIAGVGVWIGDSDVQEGDVLGLVLELPAAPAVSATARVLRVAGDIAGLELVQVAPADRARLAAFLIAGRAVG